jgi:hypothetical protein
MTDSQDAVRDAWTPQNAAVVTDDHLVLSKLTQFLIKNQFISDYNLISIHLH